MPRTRLAELFRFLRRERAAAGQDCTDGALLQRFLEQRDEAAFEALLHRYGPMVMGVCLRVVGDTHAAEDAFQATFLVLARKAGSIRNQTSVGSWLFGVAQRIASKALAQAATRRERERRAADMAHTETIDELTWQELRTILDEEIAFLPAKYQAPVVLCHLEGKSYDQAAQELDCPKSTLARRLTKALSLLRGQLARRGLALSAAALATALTEKATAAPVAALLSINIMKAAASVAAGEPLAAGILSTQAVALAEEAMKTMSAIKMKLVALVLGLALTAGAGYAGYSAWVEQRPPKVDEKRPPVAQEQPKKNEPAAPAKVLPGAWVHDGTVGFAAFLPDGKKVVTASDDGRIRIWEYPAGKEIRRIAMPEGTVKGVLGTVKSMLALSPDGKTIAAAKLDETEIYLLDLATGKQLQVLKWPLPEAKKQFFDTPRLAFSPNGEHLAAQDRGGAVSIWDWSKGKEIRKFPASEGFGGAGLVYAPDGKSVLTIHSTNGTLPTDVRAAIAKIWDPATGKEKCTFELPSSSVSAISFSPDSNSVAACGFGALHIVDASTGKSRDLAWDKRQRGIVLGGLVFGKDGAKLYYRFPDKIVEYDVATGKPLREHKRKVENISLSPDGNTLVAPAGRRAEFFDLSGKEIASLNDDSNPPQEPDPAKFDEAAAVKHFEKLGAKIKRDDTLPGEPVIGMGITKNAFDGSPRVGDADLKALKEFKQLTTLALARAQISDAGLKELKELKQLTTLDLKYTKVTDEGLKELKGLNQLTKLYIGGTEVTDEGLKELKELKQLTTLGLGVTKVTDAGLKELRELKKLEELILTGCSNVTDAGVMELQEALPKCKIKR